jgi:hypothetical protein
MITIIEAVTFTVCFFLAVTVTYAITCPSSSSGTDWRANLQGRIKGADVLLATKIDGLIPISQEIDVAYSKAKLDKLSKRHIAYLAFLQRDIDRLYAILATCADRLKAAKRLLDHPPILAGVRKIYYGAYSELNNITVDFASSLNAYRAADQQVDTTALEGAKPSKTENLEYWLEQVNVLGTEVANGYKAYRRAIDNDELEEMLRSTAKEVTKPAQVTNPYVVPTVTLEDLQAHALELANERKEPKPMAAKRTHEAIGATGNNTGDPSALAYISGVKAVTQETPLEGEPSNYRYYRSYRVTKTSDYPVQLSESQ